MYVIVICCRILDAKTLTALLSCNIIRGQPPFFSHLVSRQPLLRRSRTTVGTLPPALPGVQILYILLIRVTFLRKVFTVNSYISTGKATDP